MFNAIKLVAPLDKSLKIEARADGEGTELYGKALDYGVAEVTTAGDLRHGASCIASSAPI